MHEDLEEFCRKYNTLCFTYRDLHRYDMYGFPTKMPEFLEKTKDFLGDNYLTALLEHKLIVPYFGGGYDFYFTDDQEAGGSLNIGEIESNDGTLKNIIMLHDNKLEEDFFAMYHEMAHTLQDCHHFFNQEELKKFYRFAIGELKYIGKTPLAQRFADMQCYDDYLCEVHANAFATACMLLRSESKKEFYQQCFKCYVRSGSTFFQALKDESSTYPSLRFYVSFPIEKEVINEITQYRKKGKDKIFFMPDGNIDVEKVAYLAEDIVHENAFSPRVFQQILDNDFKGKSGPHEKKWKPYIPEALMCRILDCANKSEKNMISKRVDENIKISDEHVIPAFEELPEIDRQSKLINMVCKLEEAHILLNDVMQIFELDVDKYPEISVEKVLSFGKLPRPVLKSVKEKTAQSGEDKEIVDEALDQYQTQINSILEDYDMSDDALCVYFVMRRNPKIRERIWKMYYDKKENNLVEIHPEKFVFPKHPIYKKDFLKMKRNYCQNLYRVWKYSKIEDKGLYSQKLKQVLECFDKGKEEVSDKKLAVFSDDLYLLYYQNPKVFAAAIDGFNKKMRGKQNKNIAKICYLNRNCTKYTNRV